MKNLPKIQDLYLDKEMTIKNDALLSLLNQKPDPKWVKEHPFIKKTITVNGQKIKVPYQYIPIERVEWLLKRIFKKYKIEILREGIAFNGVYVVVRIYFQNPLTNEMDWHDGIGASQLQTASGKSPADLANLNNGAITMAFPHAESLAIKDACDKIGVLFGSDLNRDSLDYSPDLTLIDMDENHPNWSKVVDAIKDKTATLEQVKSKYNLTENAENELTNI
jgi:hypothetical protein